MTRRLAVIVVLLAAAAAGRWRVQAVEPPRPADLDAFPAVLGDWQGRPGPAWDAAVIEALQADDYLHRIYTQPGAIAGVYVGYHASQRTGAGIHSPLNCLPGAGWQPLAAERVAFGDRGAIREVIVGKGDERQFVLYWYQSAQRVEGDEYRSKLYLVLDAIRSRRNDAALVRIVTPIDPQRADGETAARRAAHRLAALVEPEVRARLFS